MTIQARNNDQVGNIFRRDDAEGWPGIVSGWIVKDVWQQSQNQKSKQTNKQTKKPNQSQQNKQTNKQNNI